MPNILNEPEMRNWLKNSVPDLRHDPDMYNRLKQWTMTTYRRWYMRQPQHFQHIESTVANPQVTPILLICGRPRERRPIPIEAVFAHMSEHHLDYVYKVSVNYHVVLNNDNLMSTQCPVIMSEHWQWRMLAEGNYDLWIKPEVHDVLQNGNQLGNLLDWMIHHSQRLPADITRFSVEDAIAQSEDWHQDMYLRLDRLLHNRIENYEKIEIDTTDPGERAPIPTVRGTVHELKNKQSLLFEHVHMHHCVNTYWPRVERGACRLFHLELPGDTKPERATMELGLEIPWHEVSSETRDLRLPPLRWTVIQVRGPCNNAVSRDMRDLATQVCAYVNAQTNNVNTDTNPTLGE